MNTKLIVAVLFALVSVSLCDVAPPSDELVQKYNEYKATFYRRLLNLYNKMQEAAVPVVDKANENAGVQVVKGYVATVQAKPEFQAALDVASGLGAEAGTLVDNARTKILGLYQEYLRPHIGVQLNDAIDNIKTYLDTFMPAD